MTTSVKKTPYLLITAAILAISLILSFKTPVFIEFLEAKTFDFRFIVRGPRPPSPEIAIVAIDEASLSKIGRWPWSREKLSDLVNGISKAGPRAIGVDIIFSEPQSKNIDALFSSSIKKAGNVVLPFALSVPTASEAFRPKEPSPVIYNYAFMLVKEGGLNLPIVAESALLPMETYVRASSSLGHVYTQYDRDGAIRWEPLYVKLEDSYYPSFGLELARLYLGAGRDETKLIAGEGISMGNGVFIPTDASGRVLINYLGKAGSVKPYSAVDVMEGKVPTKAFNEKIVLVGATALGTGDTHITPFAQIPGIEKQAAVVDNIIKSGFLKREESTKLLDAAVIIATGAVMAFGLYRLGAVAGAALSVGLFAAYLSVAQHLFASYGIWVNVFIPSVNIVLLFSSLTLYRFLTEETKAREIKGMFSSYVTERVVEELLKNPEMAKLGGQRKEVTVLFSDIRGFTTYSEKRRPEEVVPILNEYLTEMTKIVFRWEGTLDKFVGDEIMAFWGAPLDQPGHAELAVKCALHMIKRLAELREKWIREGKEPLDIGIGLNTGEVLVGNIGAQGKKMDYTVIGDHVNLGARVEALTRQYDCHILITEFTHEKIKHLLAVHKDDVPGSGKGRIGHVAFLKKEQVKVKGKEKLITVLELKSLE